jgi:hypothetical protein
MRLATWSKRTSTLAISKSGEHGAKQAAAALMKHDSWPEKAWRVDKTVDK